MQIFWYFFFVILGLLIASFLNVCADRLPADKSIVKPPSHCDSCNRRLKVIDLIPIFSYLFTCGKCRYCGARIPIRVLLVEVFTGALFGFLFWRFGLSPAFGIASFFSCIFILILIIDLEHQLVFTTIIIPSCIVAIVIQLVMSITQSNWQIIISSLIGGVGCVILFLIIYFLSKLLLHQEGMGLGDIYIVCLIGLSLGWKNSLVAIFIGIITGGLVAIILLVLKIKGRKQAIPFGPFLSLGAIIAFPFGYELFNWYLHLIGIT